MNHDAAAAAFLTYNKRAWFTKHPKKNKKKQWVGQPTSIVRSTVTRDPEVRAANWLCDAATYNNWNIALQAEGWLELTGESRVDWRELWKPELDANPQFAWLLVHVGPEGLYRAAKLSDGEAEVMRLKQEGFTQFEIALERVALTVDSPAVKRLRWLGYSNVEIARQVGAPMGTVQSMLARGYVKIRRLVNSPRLHVRNPSSELARAA